MKLLKKWYQLRLIRKHEENIANSQEKLIRACFAFQDKNDAKRALLRVLSGISTETECEQYSNFFGRHAHDKARYRMKREVNDS
jgi:hypothetical protein